ncbi:MAG: DnaJ domain-containing protein [Spirochaetales bacterium]|nr:DnaJ domain-containing protein [Spirochaetales bacterium]
MDLSSALSIYDLNRAEFSREDLDRGFKRLVKKYHPDRNQTFSEWCHIRMTEINEAYELLMSFLEKRPVAKEPPPERERRKETVYPGAQEQTHLKRAAALFFEGVHIYYDYELTKRSLRQEGVWRYHYRKALKFMEKSLEELQKHGLSKGGTGERLFSFAVLFLEDIQSFESRIPLGARGNNTHLAYRDATEKMDRSFSDYFSSRERDREKYLTPLYKASHLLILLIENYPQTEWYNLALKKLNLLDSFLDLQDLLRSGAIAF